MAWDDDEDEEVTPRTLVEARKNAAVQLEAYQHEEAAYERHDAMRLRFSIGMIAKMDPWPEQGLILSLLRARLQEIIPRYEGPDD